MPQGYVTSEYVFKGTLLVLKIVVLVVLKLITWTIYL